MISQHWFRWWLGAVRQQAITWTNVDPDLCRHMVSLGQNELTHCHAYKQLWEHLFLSIRPSVRLSVCHTFFTIIVIDKSDVHVIGQGQRSKVKVTEFKTQCSRFRTVTPVWIPIWLRNEAQSLKWHRRGALLFFYHTPVWKTDVLCYGNVRPSVLRTSVRPSEFSGLFFNMLWDINLKLGICIQ